MFTGLIECTGTLRRVSGTSPRVLSLESLIPVAEVAVGDSIAIDGTCLTVVSTQDQLLTFEAGTETLEVTTLGSLAEGQRVNLERALRVGDRLGGHLVSGHVDGIGVLTSKEQRDSVLYLGFEAPPEVASLTAKRGSITVSGVSLTVTDVQGPIFYVGLIPHTLEVTTLGSLGLGDRVNLEADLLARYMHRLLEARDASWFR